MEVGCLCRRRRCDGWDVVDVVVCIVCIIYTVCTICHVCLCLHCLFSFFILFFPIRTKININQFNSPSLPHSSPISLSPWAPKRQIPPGPLRPVRNTQFPRQNRRTKLTNKNSRVHPPPPPTRKHTLPNPLLPPPRTPQDHKTRRLAPLRHRPRRINLRPHVPHVHHDHARSSIAVFPLEHPALHQDGAGARYGGVVGR